jgi:hypothetical protein
MKWYWAIGHMVVVSALCLCDPLPPPPPAPPPSHGFYPIREFCPFCLQLCSGVGFFTEAGVKTQLDIITQELQGEAYDEGVLSELDGATALLRVFDKPLDFPSLLASLGALHHLRSVDGLRCVEIVNTNLGKLQDWFNNTFAQTSASITTQVRQK